VADTPAAARLLDDLEQSAGLSRAALGREVLRASHLSRLPVDVALQVELALTLIFTGAQSTSLWTLPGGEQARALGHAGDPAAGSGVVAAAANELLGPRRRESWVTG